MVDYAAAVTEFRVGRALARSFSTLFRNFASFGLLALVISAPPYVYTILAGPAEAAMLEDPIIFWSQLGAAPFVIGIVNFLLGYLIMAALVYGTVQDLKGDRAGLGECFSKGVALMFPALGVAIVALLLLALVFVFTVVPGSLILGMIGAATGSTAFGLLAIPLFLALFAPTIYVWIMFWVIIPVAVIERCGLGSLRRSMALTKGYRWRIFFLLLLLIVVFIGAGLLMGVVGIIISEVATAGGVDATSAYFTGEVAIEWVISAFLSALSAVFAAVTYHDLRVAKEGVDTQEIAAVFD